MIQDGITAGVNGAPFDLKCGIVVAGGNQSGEKLFAKAPEGMNIQMTSGVIDCSSHFRTGWPKGKHIDIGIWARDPGTYDGASAAIWNVTGSHADGFPDLAATIVIDEVTETSVKGSIDVHYYLETSAVGTFEVKRCF
ncbi:MAG: hypothetical protein DYH12_15020 [Sorangiineae bacterium PRO1]|nr:hypothetical protein [Sorangiineae bacterium PRO1]